MSKILIFRILPLLGLLIGATCQAQTAYPTMQRPSNSTYPQHYGYGSNFAATPVPIPRPTYQRQYPRRYGSGPIGGIPIPIPRPTIEQPTRSYPQYYGYDGVAATPVPIPRPIYQRQYPRRYEPNPVAGIPIPIPRPTIEQPTRSYPQYYGFGGQPGNAATTPAPR